MERRHLLGLLCAAPFLAVLVSPASVGERLTGRAPGELTETQVLDRAAALVPALCPGLKRVSLRARRSDESSFNGQTQRLWIVEDGDPGESGIHIEMQADDGQIVLASLGHDWDTESGPTLDAQSAVQAAWRWLVMLGMDRQAPRWRGRVIASAPGTIRCWRVVWVAPGRMAEVTMTPGGDLGCAYVCEAQRVRGR